jgi:putative ABC transport system permease protein
MKSGLNAQFGPLVTQILVSKATGGVPGGSAARELKDSDIPALSDRTAAPHIAAVSAVVFATALAQYGQHQYRCSLAGTRADYLDMANRKLTVGTYFTDGQEHAASRVVVLGTAVVANLFDTSPDETLGRSVRIGHSNFRVIGVLASNGQQDDDAALVPLSTARAYLIGGTDTVDQLIVRASAPETVPAAQDELTTILNHRHNIREASKRDFNATAMGSLLDNATQFLFYLTLFTVAVAAISLLVGAIGIANIMLVSVTERTREIGIRKAIGATRPAIMRQFLIEAVVLAGLGGIAGITIGVAITVAAARIIPQVVPNFGAPQVSPIAIVIAFTVSLAIGVIAGVYPAYRAAHLLPIEALRYE